MTADRRNHLAEIMRRAHAAARRTRAYFASYREALSAALRCVYRAASARAYLAANRGRTLYARFVKATGEVRHMRFRYDGDGAALSGKRHLVRVWDLEKGAYRSLCLDTLACIKRAADPTPEPPTPEPKRSKAKEMEAYLAEIFG
jgi:hypothetical protein